MLQQAHLYYIPRHVLSAPIALIVPSALHFNRQQRARDKIYPGLFVVMIWAACKIRFYNDRLTILLSIHPITTQHSFHLYQELPYSCLIQSAA